MSWFFVIIPLAFVAYIAPWPINLIALIAAMPLLILEILGFLFRVFGSKYPKEDIGEAESESKLKS